MFSVNELLDEGASQHVASVLLAFRLALVGLVGFLTYSEYPFVCFVTLGLSLFTLIAVKWHKGTLAWCHIFASSIWAGIASGLMLKQEWLYSAVFVALVAIETMIAFKQVRGTTCR